MVPPASGEVSAISQMDGALMPDSAFVSQLGGPVQSWKFLPPVFIAAITTLCLGYDAGVMSGAIGPITDQFDLSDLQKGIAVGCINIVAAPGALMGGKLADWKGRVPATMITALILAVGPLLVATSTGFAQLFVGRMVTGVGVGFSFVISPLYGAEVSPPQLRAAIVSVTEILINLGVVLGYLSALLLELPSLKGNMGWRLVTGLAAVPALLTIVCFPLLSESPRWLMQVNRRADALRCLERLRGGAGDAVDGELRSIEDAIKMDAQEAGWGEVLCPSKQVQRMLVVGIGIAFFQQMCGSEAIVYYSPTILERLGLTGQTGQNMGTIAVGVAKFLGACCGAIFLDKLGRRPAVLVSCLGVAGTLAGLAGLQNVQGASVAAGLTLLCAYMIFFEIGLAPAAFVLGTECYPMAIRAKALSLGMFTTRFLSGVVSIAFPPIVEALTLEPCLWIFFGFIAAGVVWAWIVVPETKGLPLEAVSRHFEEPVRCCPRQRRP